MYVKIGDNKEEDSEKTRKLGVEEGVINRTRWSAIKLQLLLAPSLDFAAICFLKKEEEGTKK
jgi:hypothetical protein